MKIIKVVGKDIFTVDSASKPDKKLKLRTKIIIDEIYELMKGESISELHVKEIRGKNAD